jgi:[histone H3]-lysine36 N-trimethyltransferase
MARIKSEASTPGSDQENGVKQEESPTDGLALPSSSVTRPAEDAEEVATSPSPPANIKASASPSPQNLTHDPVDVKLEAAKPDGGVSPVKLEMPKKSSRAAAARAPPRIAPSFSDYPDATAEATSSFQVITSSTYQNKYLGFTESALECDCSEEWGIISRRCSLCTC